jgi:hypothetical protein
VRGRPEGSGLPAGSGGGASRGYLAARQHSVHPAYIQVYMRQHIAGTDMCNKIKI